jgi:hypothetical protein
VEGQPLNKPWESPEEIELNQLAGDDCVYALADEAGKITFIS